MQLVDRLKPLPPPHPLPVASAAVHSQSVVILLLIRCLMFILLYVFSDWSLFCNAALSIISNLAEVERAACFTIIVL